MMQHNTIILTEKQSIVNDDCKFLLIAQIESYKIHTKCRLEILYDLHYNIVRKQEGDTKPKVHRSEKLSQTRLNKEISAAD